MERISVENISKKFRIGHKKNKTTLAGILSFFSGREPKKEFFALDSVSFSVKSGEVVGVIGKNSCGKSTLLRTIAGIYHGDDGRVITRGKIVSLIGLDRGTRIRLTMRDNILLLCAFFGLGQNGIKRQFDDIVQFSGLEKFLDTKLYQFSHGMLQRLVFSIGIHCCPDILLLDEVLAVGDREFRMRSAGRIKDLARAGAASIFVSHELWLVEQYCDRVIYMDEGKIVAEGNAVEMVKRYEKDNPSAGAMRGRL